MCAIAGDYRDVVCVVKGGHTPSSGMAKRKVWWSGGDQVSSKASENSLEHLFVPLGTTASRQACPAAKPGWVSGFPD